MKTPMRQAILYRTDALMRFLVLIQLIKPHQYLAYTHQEIRLSDG